MRLNATRRARAAGRMAFRWLGLALAALATKDWDYPPLVPYPLWYEPNQAPALAAKRCAFGPRGSAAAHRSSVSPIVEPLSLSRCVAAAHGPHKPLSGGCCSGVWPGIRAGPHGYAQRCEAQSVRARRGADAPPVHAARQPRRGGLGGGGERGLGGARRPRVRADGGAALLSLARDAVAARAGHVVVGADAVASRGRGAREVRPFARRRGRRPSHRRRGGARYRGVRGVRRHVERGRGRREALHADQGRRGLPAPRRARQSVARGCSSRRSPRGGPGPGGAGPGARPRTKPPRRRRGCSPRPRPKKTRATRALREGRHRVPKRLRRRARGLQGRARRRRGRGRESGAARRVDLRAPGGPPRFRGSGARGALPAVFRAADVRLRPRHDRGARGPARGPALLLRSVLVGDPARN